MIRGNLLHKNRCARGIYPSLAAVHQNLRVDATLATSQEGDSRASLALLLLKECLHKTCLASYTLKLKILLPFLLFLISEDAASRNGENTKSKMHQKINNFSCQDFHGVFIKLRPCHLRFISWCTAGWVKNCKRNAVLKIKPQN